jgi:YfiH family protein
VIEGGAAEICERRADGSGPPRFELHEWREIFGIAAGITGARDDFDLGLWGPHAGAVILRNWQAFQDSFSPDFGLFVVGHQVHGTLIGRWNGGQTGLVLREGLDGHVTTQRGILLTVLVADCVPVYLFDPTSNTFALLHAGWRGIAAGILEAGFEQLRAVSGARYEDLVMHCGISICGRCYEVGPEVLQQVLGAGVDAPRNLDLRAVLVDRACRLGIERVTVSSFCTVHDSGQFHSFRARGEEAGRMAAYLGVPLS